jgi:hypothetical protein
MNIHRRNLKQRMLNAAGQLTSCTVEENKHPPPGTNSSRSFSSSSGSSSRLTSTVTPVPKSLKQLKVKVLEGNFYYAPVATVDIIVNNSTGLNEFIFKDI